VTQPVLARTLTDGGRLIFPVTANQGFMADDPTNATSRAVFQIERRMSHFSVQCISRVRIIPCDDARDETSEAALAEAFKKGDCEPVTRLYRNNDDVPDDRCWLRGSRWCLAYD
jgi:protein-L-isoaspartate(D-aspartate) O-methyltransferase